MFKHLETHGAIWFCQTYAGKCLVRATNAILFKIGSSKHTPSIHRRRTPTLVLPSCEALPQNKKNKGTIDLCGINNIAEHEKETDGKVRMSTNKTSPEIEPHVRRGGVQSLAYLKSSRLRLESPAFPVSASLGI